MDEEIDRGQRLRNYEYDTHPLDKIGYGHERAEWDYNVNSRQPYMMYHTRRLPYRSYDLFGDFDQQVGNPVSPSWYDELPHTSLPRLNRRISKRPIMRRGVKRPYGA